jgi:hypothetical protein
LQTLNAAALRTTQYEAIVFPKDCSFLSRLLPLARSLGLTSDETLVDVDGEEFDPGEISSIMVCEGERPLDLRFQSVVKHGETSWGIQREMKESR